MNKSLKCILLYYSNLAINELVVMKFFPNFLRETLCFILTSTTILYIINVYKKAEYSLNKVAYSLKNHFKLIVLSIFIFICYSITESSFLNFFIARSDYRYTFTLSNIMYTVILAPLAEELLFRGLLINQIAKRQNFIVANILQSFIFAILHVELTAIIFCFIFGVILGMVYKYTNIYCCILIHCMNNILTVLVVMLEVKIIDLSKNIFLFIGIIFLIVTLLLLNQMKNIYKVNHRKIPITKTEVENG